MIFTRNEKLEKVDGVYIWTEDFVADKLKNEEFPSDKLKEQYPEDFVHVEKHSISKEPKLKGEIGYFGCTMIIIN